MTAAYQTLGKTVTSSSQGSTNPSSNGVSPLYVDGFPIEDLLGLAEENSDVLGTVKVQGANQFWATPMRDLYSTYCEVFQVSIGAPKIINSLSFYAARFPCMIWAEWLDPDTGTWRPFQSRSNGQAIQLTINESVPRRVHSGVYDGAHRHPQHRAAGHWEQYQLTTVPVTASQVRLVLSRFPSTKVPVEIGTGKPAPYSLAIKEFQFGYVISSVADIPRTPILTQQVHETTPFATSQDLLGSTVQYSLAQYSAADLMWPTLAVQAGASAGDIDGYGDLWKSEPQPYPYAVINLYVDARDEGGNPQPVDRFFLETPTPGADFNLYYSNDIPDLSAEFTASDDPICYPGLIATGNPSPGPYGITFPDSQGYIDIDQKYFRPNIDQPWWFGIRFQPLFDSTDTSPYVVLDAPLVNISWDGSQWVVTVAGVVTTFEGAFVSHDTVNLVVSYDGVGIGTITVTDVTAYSVNVGDLVGQEDGSIWRWGSQRTNGSGVGNYLLNGFVFKQEELTTQGLSEWLHTETNTYLVPSDIDSQTPWDYTANALLRIAVFFQAAPRNPFGAVGGPRVDYASLTWTPIERDFTLETGFVEFNPVLARFWNFEFSNLVPQVYQSSQPQQRTVRLFPADIVATDTATQAPAIEAGTKVNMDSALAPIFTDQVRNVYLSNPLRSYGGYTPTEALYATDPGAQDRLAALNPAFRFQPWHGTGPMPRFTQTQQHVYRTVSVSATANLAYSVALSKLRMYRVDYSVAVDTADYLIPFHDLSLISGNDHLPWRLSSPSGIHSPDSLPYGFQAQTTSLPMLSQSAVRGVQFATVQSDPVQLLADSDFSDESLTHWRPYGSALVGGPVNVGSIGSVITIDRDSPDSAWRAIEFADWPDDTVPRTWADVEAYSGGLWEGLEDPGLALPYGGIQTAPDSFVQPSPRGRIYVAARVFCSEQLTAPLFLEIIDQNGNALAVSEVMPKPGGITEWFTGYDLDATTVSGLYSDWEQVEYGDAPTDDSPNTWGELELRGSWAQVESSVSIDAYAGPVGARLIQNGVSRDSWQVDTISIYEDSIIWEFSVDEGISWHPGYDIKNDPYGVLLFPTDPNVLLSATTTPSLMWRVSTYRGNQWVKHLYIRPWYDSRKLGIPSPEGINHGGPNTSNYDQYPTVTDSPFFKAWDKPIPRNWWFTYRQYLMAGGIPLVTDDVAQQIYLSSQVFVLTPTD